MIKLAWPLVVALTPNSIAEQARAQPKPEADTAKQTATDKENDRVIKLNRNIDHLTEGLPPFKSSNFHRSKAEEIINDYAKLIIEKPELVKEVLDELKVKNPRAFYAIKDHIIQLIEENDNLSEKELERKFNLSLIAIAMLVLTTLVTTGITDSQMKRNAKALANRLDSHFIEPELALDELAAFLGHIDEVENGKFSLLFKYLRRDLEGKTANQLGISQEFYNTLVNRNADGAPKKYETIKTDLKKLLDQKYWLIITALRNYFNNQDNNVIAMSTKASGAKATQT